MSETPAALRVSVDDAAERLLQVLPPLFKQLMGEARQQMPDEFAIGELQFRIVHVLTHRDYTIGDLAEIMRVRTPTISRMVDSLVERGQVARHADPSDRRKVWLRLTPAGRELARGMDRCFHAAVARFLQPLGSQDLTLVVAVCDKLEALLAGEPTAGPGHASYPMGEDRQ